MNQRRILSVGLCLALTFYSLTAAAQRRNAAYEQYIKQYSPWAIELMKEYKVPASIKLAQGLLESGAGKSSLATEANNHFGIKCGSSWNGRTTRRTDDAPNECFRVYRNARESYEDHAKFLTQNPRYSSLFRLSITDYKAWAQGLKQAGYATDPSYANRLITIIELYELYQFDGKTVKASKPTVPPTKPALSNTHPLYQANGLLYIRVQAGDTFESIAKETGKSVRKLLSYNDLHRGYTLSTGELLYLQKKHKSSNTHLNYVVREGDSMHTISQMFGIRLKSLYALNGVKADEYTPLVGDLIWLK